VAKEFNSYEGICEGLVQILLSVVATNKDSPTYHQAINGPNSEDFREAIEIQVDTLQEVMRTWI